LFRRKLIFARSSEPNPSQPLFLQKPLHNSLHALPLSLRERGIAAMVHAVEVAQKIRAVRR
jgi:hypothetical protein